MSDTATPARPTHYSRPLVSLAADDNAMSVAFLDAFYNDPFNRLVAQSRVQCADMPDVFSPNEDELADETDHDRDVRIAWAKAICATCPILDACKARGIDRNELAGIWGGLSGRQRRTEREGVKVKRVPLAERTHCDAGHEYTDDNTAIKLNDDGTFRERRCRICSRIRGAAYRARVRSGAVARDRKAREATA